mmetsp:Transcript_15185/g.21196  ORF Transcript_15185/g.21196 Transcript_15185/m.21196 type:complete len:89 (-) Transcript_15185:64-330(-)|eukprot:CAMPEP_0168548740 /NCGR_PEP_ID=MMETSP0413-20121227/4730_1 /TAXON_ID=136452 /ORGANISM="Filamoeba nolandi, Strain NC-AS-23-1" /LENGTH=88 /DNA_ID=CAMNT_0008579079 /DNA_START=30 /DNA_END=296 /DNA_ORIENTATION=-
MPQGKEKLKPSEKKEKRQAPLKMKKGRVEKKSKKASFAHEQKMKKKLIGKHLQDIEDMTAKKVLHSSGKLAVLKTMEDQKKAKKKKKE